MKSSANTLMALTAVCLLIAGGGAVLLSNIDEASATPNLYQITPTNDRIYVVSVGHAISVDIGEGSDFTEIHSKPSWLSISGRAIATGTAPATGIYTIDLTGIYEPDYEERFQVQLHVVNAGDVELTTILYYNSYSGGKIIAIDYTTSTEYITNRISLGNGVFATEYKHGNQTVTPYQAVSLKTISTTGLPYALILTTKTATMSNISFDSKGGSSVSSITRINGDVYGDLPVPTKSGYMFGGWYYTTADNSVKGPIAPNWIVSSDLNLWAKWIQPLEIPYTAPNINATANVNWSYTPTTESGVTVTVSGVDWLSVNGTNLYGVPPATGEYNITIHMSKQGFTDRTETFTLNVVSMLVVLNSPNYGVIIYSV